MKKTKAFTLIELLTVIAIIGILAGILIPTVSAVRTSANKARTKAQFSQWATSMGLFKQEYGYYPAIATGGNKIDSNIFFPALTGKTATGSTPSNFYGNKKRLSFYSASDADVSTTDEGYSSGDSGKLKDGFGNIDIAVFIDTNGDGVIDTDLVPVTSYDDNKTATPDLPTGGVRAGVVFYSAGKGEGQKKNVVTSW